MSYNTRRSNTGYGSNPQAQPAAAVGQRRPVVTNNFISGGQLGGGQQQKPNQPQQRPVQQQQTGINFRNQQAPNQQNYQNPSNYSQQQQPPPQQQQPPPQQQQPPPKQQSPATKPAPPATKPATPAAKPATPVKMETSMETIPPPPENSKVDETVETNSDETKKKPWFKNKGGKVTKAEKVRRRNMRLSKILQPKNAVMILNELIKGCQYTVDELPCKIDANQFRATVTFEGQEFAGAGRTKILAKNAAAETALKYLVKNKQLKLKKDEDSDGDEKMEIGEEDGSPVMPWSHIASFAMYKLFSNWGEDPSVVSKVPDPSVIPKAAGSGPASVVELRPAKKMPENPEKMNPLMLMNQMLPGAQWVEVGKSGNPPNVVFTFSVTVDGKTFTGTGTNKKSAKKLAAFAACNDILKIDYPTDIWVPLY